MRGINLKLPAANLEEHTAAEKLKVFVSLCDLSREGGSWSSSAGSKEARPREVSNRNLQE